MPALTSSMWAPASTWAIVSRSTRLKSPAFISSASILRPVGLMRSPMITNGRSNPMTTSRVAELTTVSVTELSFALSRFVEFLLGRSLRSLLQLRIALALRMPWRASFEHAGFTDHFGDRLLLPIRHHVHAGHALDRPDLADEVDADAAP